jgi:hypothetical protein
LRGLCRSCIELQRGFRGLQRLSQYDVGQFQVARDFQIRRRRGLNNRLMIIVRVRRLGNDRKKILRCRTASSGNWRWHDSIQRTPTRLRRRDVRQCFRKLAERHAVINDFRLRHGLVKCGDTVWISLMQIHDQKDCCEMKYKRGAERPAPEVAPPRCCPAQWIVGCA